MGESVVFARLPGSDWSLEKLLDEFEGLQQMKQDLQQKLYAPDPVKKEHEQGEVEVERERWGPAAQGQGPGGAGAGEEDGKLDIMFLIPRVHLDLEQEKQSTGEQEEDEDDEPFARSRLAMISRETIQDPALALPSASASA